MPKKPTFLRKKASSAVVLHTNSKPGLYDFLMGSYKDKKARDKLAKNGYTMDKELSDHNSQIWHRKNETGSHLVQTVAGTHNLKDVQTDLKLLIAPQRTIETDKRFTQEKKKIQKAKEKYQPSQTTIVGHSLGGAVASSLAGEADNVLTYNKAAPPLLRQNQKNEVSIRTPFDPVSFLNRNAKGTITLDKKSYNPHTTLNLEDQDIALI